MIQNEVQAVPMTAAGPLQLPLGLRRHRRWPLRCQNGMVMQQARTLLRDFKDLQRSQKRIVEEYFVYLSEVQ